VDESEPGDNPNLDTAFLDTVSTNHSKAWVTLLSIKGKQKPFKLDTGAEVTAISKSTWESLRKPLLHSPNKQLFCPARQPLQVLGHLQAQLCHKAVEATQQVFVVKGLKTDLLGLPAILDLASRVDSAFSEPLTTEAIKTAGTVLTIRMCSN